MEVYVITKHRYTDGEGTAVYLLGVVTEENLAETMKEAKKNILNDFRSNRYRRNSIVCNKGAYRCSVFMRFMHSGYFTIVFDAKVKFASFCVCKSDDCFKYL